MKNQKMMNRFKQILNALLGLFTPDSIISSSPVSPPLPTPEVVIEPEVKKTKPKASIESMEMRLKKLKRAKKKQ